MVSVLVAVVSGCSLVDANLPSVPFPLRLPLASAGGSAVPSLLPSPSPSPDRTPRAATGRSLPAGYIYRGPSTHKWIALTFDEDVRPGMYAVRNKTRWYDPRIIDLRVELGAEVERIAAERGLDRDEVMAEMRRIMPDVEL